MRKLLEKIEKRTARVAIIGLGYVGLPLLVELYAKGFTVYGIDTDKDKISSLKVGESYLHEIPKEVYQKLAKDTLVSFSSSFDHLAEADIVVICVPTPLTAEGIPDLQHVTSAIQEISKRLHDNMLVILESTTYPGTTREILYPSLATERLLLGIDYCLAYSPERMNPGQLAEFRKVPRIIGGMTQICRDIAEEFYRTIFINTHPVSSPEVAEMCKLLENTFRNVNINLINELAILMRKMNIDIWEVIEAAATKPYGFMPFYPGPGIGGHCIPVDPVYLLWKARKEDCPLQLIEQSIRSQQERIAYLVQEISRITKPLSAKPCLLFLGVTFKADIEDTRESPILQIIDALQHQGMQISYHDPYIAKLNLSHTNLISVADNDLERRIKEADAVILGTDHRQYKLEIGHWAKQLIDLRGLTRGQERPNIVRL